MTNGKEGTGKRLTPEEWQRVTQEYQTGKSIKAVAVLFGLNPTTVQRHLQVNKLVRNSEEAAKCALPKRKTRHFTKEEDEYICKEYQAGKTLSELCRILDRVQYSVTYRLHRYGIPLRSAKKKKITDKEVLAAMSELREQQAVAKRFGVTQDTVSKRLALLKSRGVIPTHEVFDI